MQIGGCLLYKIWAGLSLIFLLPINCKIKIDNSSVLSLIERSLIIVDYKFWMDINKVITRLKWQRM